MPTVINPRRLNHFNLVLENFDDSVAHFQGLFDAEFLADIPNPEAQAGLIEVGRVIFELFIPRAWLLTARYGPHYIGVEYEADMDEVRAAVSERGIRIIRDVGVALHTHPEDTFGVAFEFYDGNFHDRTWDMLDGRTMHSASHWADEHPLGLTGLNHYSIAVQDAGAAGRFLKDFLGAELLYRKDRPHLAARSHGYRISDDVVEVEQPTGAGPLAEHLAKFGDGIRSVQFGVRNLSIAHAYFVERGAEAKLDAAAKVITLAKTSNLGINFEFGRQAR